MEAIFTTSDFHPRDRLNRWYDISSKLYVGHHCSVAKSEAFDASISVSRLGQIEASLLLSSPVRFIRSPRHISATEEPHIFLCLQRQGRSIWIQDGREGVAEVGDFGLLNAQRPYELTFCERAAILVLKVPLREMEQRVGPMIGLTAVTVSGKTDLGGLASGFLALLPERLPFANEQTASRIADHALDLVAMALLSATTESRPTLSSARQVSLAALRVAIDSNLADANLTTDVVAKAAGISVRYASQLLSERGTSVSRCILERRLEECRRLLADPSQAHRSVTEIALSWGFSDPSHFARRFKQAYGRSPRDYRQATSGQSPPHVMPARDWYKY